jgi:hypothetical protein
MKKLIVVALGCTLASGAIAKTAGFQASLTPDIAIQDRDTEITGVSIGVWNENPGPEFNWQFGFVNGATGDSVGVQWFVFLPTIFNYAENHTGAQLGFVNYTSGDFLGAQLGMVNIAGTLTGLQWGLVNYAETAQNGLQIGLVNIIEDNEWFSDFPNDLAKGMVIVNWSFGGSE